MNKQDKPSDELRREIAKFEITVGKLERGLKKYMGENLEKEQKQLRRKGKPNNPAEFIA